MVMVVSVDVKNGKALDKLSGIVTKYPMIVGESGHEFALEYKRQLIWQLTGRKMLDTWTLFNSIKAEKKSKFRSIVKMALYGVQLETMRPHYVALKRRRKIIGWVKRKYSHGAKVVSGKSKVFRTHKGGIKGFLYVTPRPWISTAYSKAIVRFPEIIKRKSKKAITGG